MPKLTTTRRERIQAMRKDVDNQRAEREAEAAAKTYIDVQQVKMRGGRIVHPPRSVHILIYQYGMHVEAFQTYERAKERCVELWGDDLTFSPMSLFAPASSVAVSGPCHPDLNINKHIQHATVLELPVT
jgi:hypothetical protein